MRTDGRARGGAAAGESAERRASHDDLLDAAPPDEPTWSELAAPVIAPAVAALAAAGCSGWVARRHGAWLGIAHGENGNRVRALELLADRALERPEALPIVSNAMGLAVAARPV